MQQVRGVLASAVAIIAAITFRAGISDADPTIMIPVIAILIGALIIHLPSLGAQLLGRALLWSNLVLGGIICTLKDPSSRSSTPALALLIGCGLALILADRKSLRAAATARGERPAAYAGTIELMMVLALADAQTCLLFAFLDRGESFVLFGAATVALVIGFIGLYRLALWGILVTMSTAAALAVALLSGQIRHMGEIAIPLTIVFAGQLIAPLPMLVSMLTKRELPSMPPHLRSHVASALIGVLVMTITTYHLSR